jgi:hypothetical protein
MTANVTLSDKVAAVGVAVILGGLAIGINHFQKLSSELTNQLPVTPVRELASIQQTCVPRTPVKPKAGIPITSTRDRHGQHTPAHG